MTQLPALGLVSHINWRPWPLFKLLEALAEPFRRQRQSNSLIPPYRGIERILIGRILWRSLISPDWDIGDWQRIEIFPRWQRPSIAARPM